MKKLIIIPFILLLLAACQSTNQVESERTEVNEEIVDNDETVNNEEIVNNEHEEEVIDYELYDEVIDAYSHYSGLSYEMVNDASFDFIKDGGFYYFADRSLYSGISAARYDLNGDGVEELIIALRTPNESYVLIDMYTIKENEVLTLFENDLSGYIGLKRTGITLLENTDIITTTATAQGERFANIYTFNEEKFLYEEIEEYSDENENYDVAEDALETALDLEDLDWEKIDEKSVRLEALRSGDFSQLSGTWENALGEQIIIDGKNYIDKSGEEKPLKLEENDSSLSIGGDEEFMEFMIYYPKNEEITVRTPEIDSDISEDRIIAWEGQGAPSEDNVYYKLDN